MSHGRGGEITVLLQAWKTGDEAALDRLTLLVAGELRRIARRYLRGETAADAPVTTELINESYLRLLQGGEIDWEDRAHFFGVLSQIMRRILVDAARKRTAQKRGGGIDHPDSTIEEDLGNLHASGWRESQQLLALDDALERLAEFDNRKAKVIELRFFGGLSVDETAEALNVSQQTVLRDWRLARSWLARELGG